MANDTYYFKGEAQWAKVQEPDSKYNIYTIDVFLDKDSYASFKSSGLQLKVREDKDSRVFVKFRRPVQKLLKKELVNMGPPTVLIKEDDDYVPFAGLIGNGSIVRVKVRVFDTMKGKGHELETVAVDTLVPYGGETFGLEGDDLPF